MNGDSEHEPIPISFGADQLKAAALARQQTTGQETLCLNHWLLTLIEQGRALGAALPEADKGALASRIKDEVFRGEMGPPLEPETVFAQARVRAAQLGHAVVTTEDVAAAILANAGYGEGPGADQMIAGAEQAPGAGAPAAGAPGTGGSYAPRAASPTPTLDQFGRDLTREALEGKLPALVGREEELRQIQETICRRTKRNPALVGPAGTGKTAIVEGLAQRIVSGEVPDVLKNIRIVSIQPSSLTAGSGVVGELESRMKAVIGEASQDGIILFIDELHSIMGSGGRVGVSDVGALIKPALARGSISVIGATTNDEYRDFIESDKALERRFSPVHVQEPPLEETRLVMVSHRDSLSKLRRVTVEDVVLDWLLDFADQYLRNRAFPDKAVDLLEQCVAHAVVEQKSEVGLADAKVVAERMIGMPIELGERLAGLESRLVEEGLLLPEDAEHMSERLNVTMQGLDVRPERPNTVLLLMGPAAAVADSVSIAVAEELLGGTSRIVDLDFGQFTDSEDVNTLLGPPPGYIGFEGRRPLHALMQMPWAVLVCRNVDRCHPEIAAILAQALADGVVTERSGRRIYLSDAVIVLTAGGGAGGPRQPIGFLPQEEKSSQAEESGGLRARAAKVLGQGFVGQVDIICDRIPEAGSGARNWIERSLLADLSERYRQRGLEVEWDAGVVDWIVEQRKLLPQRCDLVRMVEDAFGSALLPHLPSPGSPAATVSLTAREGGLVAKLALKKSPKAKEAES
jgi:ATP-dependent Clp protease ATP-binding subunit ClpC